MNKKLRALCKSLKKKKAPVIAKPEEESKPEPAAVAPKVQRSVLQEDNTYTSKSDAQYKVSEAERRRRMISDLRNESQTNETLTPYQLAMKEAKREEEKKKLELLKQQRRERLQEENDLRLDKNVFNTLSVFMPPGGAVSNPKICSSLANTFKFDVDKVMEAAPGDESSVKKESVISKADLVKAKNELKSWISEFNSGLKKRDVKSFEKDTFQDSFLFRESEYPWLFRTSRLNQDKKNKLVQSIHTCEQEVGHLQADIDKVNKAAWDQRVKKAEKIAERAINDLDFKIGDVLYKYHEQRHMEDKKLREEKKKLQQEGQKLA